MRVSGDQNIQPFHLARGLDIFIQRPAYVGAALARLTRRHAFVDQRHGQIHFVFQLINVVLQPLNLIPRVDPDAHRSGDRIVKGEHAVQADHANLHAILFDNRIRLIPERFGAVLIKNIALYDRKFRLAEL
ncbi:hypothetical protein D3C75_772460 [compost metagenome]